MIAPQETVEM